MYFYLTLEWNIVYQYVNMNLKCLTIVYKLVVWALKSMIFCNPKSKHRSLHHTIESIIALRVANYHCSLLSWNHLQANGQAAHSIHSTAFLTVKAQGRHLGELRERERTLTTVWAEWPKAYRKLYDCNEKMQQFVLILCGRERKKEMVDLFKCLHCKANLLNECFPFFCLWDPLYLPSPHIEDHPRGARRQVLWHLSGVQKFTLSGL